MEAAEIYLLPSFSKSMYLKISCSINVVNKKQKKMR